MKVLGCVVFLGVLLLAGACPAPAAPFSGRVFLDANGNGAFDPGERGVAGCVVSDERALAHTGADGGYTLDLPAGPAVLFVVNPPGTCPTGAWWIHVADGSRGARHDFALREEKQEEPLYFVQGTDIHLRPDTLAAYARYVAHVNALPVPVRFVVHTGDLVVDANMLPPVLAKPLFDLYARASAGFRVPRRDLMGNHEVVGCFLASNLGGGRGSGKGLYRERLGPATYAFRYGRCHFVALDGTGMEGSKPTFRLAPESGAWAAQYLADVPAEEPIILLIHEPLGKDAASVRLQAALQGKKLMATLCGHGHGRSITTWGGAPQIMGGAVSYAWHGLLPVPPQPHGYVLYRVEGDRFEHVFLDWAEERSFDVAQPAWTGTASGKQVVKGVVSDFDGSITAVECTLADRRAALSHTRRNALAREFAGEIDLSGLGDGVYDLLLTARAGEREWQERQPVVVANGLPTQIESAAPATLTFRVEGVKGPGNEVLLNGEPLGTLPVDATPTKEVELLIPGERLRRLNTFTFRAAAREGGADRLVVRALWVECDGKRYRDVRHAPMQGRQVRPPAPGQAPEVTACVDVTYGETRAPAE